MGGRVPNVPRLEDTMCRTRERMVHHVHGLAPGVIAAIIFVGQRPLGPRFGARDLCHWEDLARPATLHPARAASGSAAGIGALGSWRRKSSTCHLTRDQGISVWSGTRPRSVCVILCLRLQLGGYPKEGSKGSPASWAVESSTTRPLRLSTATNRSLPTRMAHSGYDILEVYNLPGSGEL